MKLRILFFVFCWSTIILKGQEIQIDYYAPSPVPDRIILCLTEDPAKSIAVNWRTSLNVTNSYVQYTKVDPSPDVGKYVSVEEGEFTSLLSDQNGANYHSAIIKGLDPETMYAYRVGDSLQWSEWAHFTTASNQKEKCSFIYFGDAQNDLKSLWSRTIRGAYSKAPKANFMLHAGDLINSANADSEWGEWFYAGGWIYRMMPSMATPGNHEYIRNDKGNAYLSKHWNPTFTFPENGPEGLEETVYYLDYENIRLISLNTQIFYLDESYQGVQMEWLESVLQKNKQKWTIVLMHHPIYSSKQGRDNTEIRESFKPIFEALDVDLVLQGHDHTYGRGTNMTIGSDKRIEGPMYVVSVSGPKMYDLGFAEWMQRSGSNTQLYQIIHVDGDNLKFEAYMVNDELYDAFELQKQPDGKNLFIDLAPEGVKERLDLPERYKMNYTSNQWKIFREKYKAYKDRKSKK